MVKLDTVPSLVESVQFGPCYACLVIEMQPLGFTFLRAPGIVKNLDLGTGKWACPGAGNTVL